jgi:hypothetical protein
MKQLPIVFAAICLLTVGCGTSPITFPKVSPLAANQILTCDTTTPSIQSNSQFAIQPSLTTVNLYPGQTSTLDVALPNLGGAGAQQVQVLAAHVPVGLSIAAVQATTGGTAQLTLQATAALAFNCFTGVVDGVDSATMPIVISAIGASGQSSSIVNLNVVLENPGFSPSKTDLPVIQLTTTDATAVISENDYIPGNVSITDPSNADNNFHGSMQIQGHGHSTWLMPKKPYDLKLSSKAGLLGMASGKKWVLLANYDDKPLLRNALAFHISQMFQMVWTPDSRFVELYLNGNYQGVYQISEKVEIDPNRLNITEIGDDDNSGDALTGGYLLEIDLYEDATFVFHTPSGLPIDSDDPDPPTQQQQTYITGVVDNAENALFSSSFTNSSTGWPAYFDKDSLVNWFIVQELMGNQDADFASSDYFYKQRGDPLLYMGPVWDFDASAGNTFAPISNPSIPWVSVQASWYKQLFRDPVFMAAVKARWTQIRPQVNDIPGFIDSTAASLAQGQQNNYARWPTLYDLVWPNPVALGTYQAEVTHLKQWMADRVTYMDATYGK